MKPNPFGLLLQIFQIFQVISMSAAFHSLGMASEAVPNTLDHSTTWTTTRGTTFHARLAGSNGTHFFLEQDGRYHEIPQHALSPESIAKARKCLEHPSAPHTSILPAAGSPPQIRRHVPRKTWTPPPVSPSPSARPRIDRHGMTIHPFHVRVRTVRTTAYSCAESDHLAFGARNALGTPLLSGTLLRSAAADWSIYPVGTQFRIEGLPCLFVIDDYGSALVGTGTIDLYHPDIQSMKLWGRRNVEIHIVNWGSLRQSAKILSSRKHHDHCRAMWEAITRRNGS
jgi:3D (Asp-Asp-Asp) domain-containing protein